MKNPLQYQLSEYDCGPTSLLNAISFLFDRAEIPPELIRNIMLYSLDCYGANGDSGKSGTSRAAMTFLSNWLRGYGEVGKLPVFSRYLSGQQVYLGGDSAISDALHRGGVAVVRVFLDEWHYVLLTGERDDLVLVFDPYYGADFSHHTDIRIVTDDPCRCNRLVPMHRFNRVQSICYALGALDSREAVLVYNEATKLTAEKTIEYFI